MSLTRFSNRLLYQEYRRRLDVREVLAHYGAENCSEVVGSDGTTEIVHSCLLDKVEPHHAHGDQNPSASANVDKKLYICYAYWSGDIFHLIAKMEGKSNLGQIVPIIGEFLSGATSSAADFQAEIEDFFKKLPHGADLPSYSPKILEPWKAYHPYLAQRGITREAADLLHLGVNEADNRIVIPNFFEGHLVGWQARALSSTEFPKYRNSSAFPRAETLYGLDLVRGNQVVVVESPMSVAKAYSLGIADTLATFGASVTAQQIELLKRFGRVTVWFDDDKPGRAGARKLLEGLYRSASVFYVEPDHGRDLADCSTFGEVRCKLDQARPAALVLGDWDAARRLYPYFGNESRQF